MDEHRKEERKKIMTFTPVHDLNKNILLGYIADLTLQGALLVGERNIEIYTELILAIDFPETPEFIARRMVIPARVAWCKREQDSPYYDTGVEFQKLDQPERTILEAILERYQYRREFPT